MIIPPSNLAGQLGKSTSSEGVYLEAKHICFDKAISEKLFKNEMNVYLAHYPEKKYIIIAPTSHQYFKKMHPCSQHMLKTKNLNGERSIALHELIIDHDISQLDGPLTYEIKEKSNIIKIAIQ